MKQTYIQYGVASGLANKLEQLNLPKTTFEKTSISNLCNNYGLEKEEVKLVKELIKRNPIDNNTINSLLENSNYTCCICKGVKSDSYIIHHIEEYSVNQNNEYHNLAVLCPSDHDLAHKKGHSLTLKITEEQIFLSKEKWEKEVQDRNIERASLNGNIFEIDFLNVPRILELYLEIFKKKPTTKHTQELIKNDLIDNNGNINYLKISRIADNPNTPLIFFAPLGSTTLRYHYFDIFKKIISKLKFTDLDSLLNKTSVKKGLLGEYCYYVGGLYSSTLPKVIDGESEFMRFHLKKKKFIVQWLVDPKFFTSSSSKWRTDQRNVYMIYGKIRNVNIETIEDKKYIVLDLRPYCFGLPEKRKDRKPLIAYKDFEYDEVFDDDE